MKAIIQGTFMEEGKGYTKKDTNEHVSEIIVYSSGETIKISGIGGSQFDKFQDVSLLCNIRSGQYGLNIFYIG